MHSKSGWKGSMMMSAVQWEYDGARTRTVVASAYSTRGSDHGKTVEQTLVFKLCK